MALSRVHTSANAQQSPVIQSTPIQHQTQSHVTIIPQLIQRQWVLLQPQLTLTLMKYYLNYHQNVMVSSMTHVPLFCRVL